MDDFIYISRNLYSDELRQLIKLKKQIVKQSLAKIKLYPFFIAALLGICLTCIVTIIPDSIWTFLLGTIAVSAFAFIIFAPYEIYKNKKKQKQFLQKINTVLENGTVYTSIINSKRIAIAPEYEDESDLYIIEIENNKVLYIWDYEYNLKKKFPCLKFEIYEDSFFKLIGKQIYPLSEKIQPIKINKKAKWNFMKKYGIIGHLEFEKINFDELLVKYNNCE